MIYDYQIAIPSYKRSETIKKKTLSVLNKYNIPIEKITIFVANEEEYDMYSKSLKDYRIEIGVPHIGPQRNFIERFYPENSRIVMFDDDIDEFLQRISEKELKPVEDLNRDIIQRGFTECTNHGAKLFGVYAVSNPFFMKERVNTNLCFIIGTVLGIVVDHDNFLKRVTDHAEDNEYSIRQYIKNGAVCRLDNFTFKSKYLKEKGGMQEIRTQQYINDSIKQVTEMFPDYCTMYIRKSTGNAELRLKDKSKNNGTPLEGFFNV